MIIDYPIRFFCVLDLLHLLRDDFTLRDGGLLVIADVDARRRSGKQLARARAGGDHEFERVGQLAAVNHVNVLTMFSASDAHAAAVAPARRRTMLRKPIDGGRQFVVDDHEIVLGERGDFLAGDLQAAPDRRLASLLRPRSRCSSTA